jgi:4-hydroxy-tetrahydrodipicolinate reductase
VIKAIVSGAAGRMGQRIIWAISTARGIELGGAIEAAGHPKLGLDAGVVAGVGHLGVAIQGTPEKALKTGQVIIEFTTPQTSIEHLELAARNGKAMVIGTTGFSPEQRDQIAQMAKKTACVFSPNMSVGVNLCFKILPILSQVLGDEYDIEIVEAHHRYKKDAPSGTALKMAQVIARALKRDLEKDGIYGRKGITGERPAEQIGIHTVRGGDIVGDHTVIFAGLGERIELTHRAHSRDTFARGAVRAALFAAQAAPGLYDMQDVLGL